MGWRDDVTAKWQGQKRRHSYDLSKGQELVILEGLYTSGQITAAEWRRSLEFDQPRSLERDWGRLEQIFGKDGIPVVILTEDEKVILEGAGFRLRIVEREDVEEGPGTRAAMDMEDDAAKSEEKMRAQSQIVDRLEEVDEDFGRETEDQEGDDSGTDTGYEAYQRSHSLTLANRFATFPSTLEMPKSSFTDPVTEMLSGLSGVHLSDAAHRIFGGGGLPYSTSTPSRGKTMQPKPIALDAYQSQMSEMEGDVYMSTLMPGMYSSVMSVLVETRKRLGTAWAQDTVRKAEAGELRILDAGASGAGVLAVRELLRAEWETMHEDGHGDESPMALAEAGGRTGGEGASPPLGVATVLTGSDTLRQRAAQLLDNTTFVPRLPDYVHTEQAKHKGKFDLVVAPHTLWPLREDYMRKTHVQNLWSLLKTDGGVLMVIEKGVARGFELIAGARDMLLDSRIASPGSEHRQRRTDEPVPASSSAADDETKQHKETGMIIAPCTNHAGCPMYVQKGLVKGRRDICSFAQRYHRPPFLQNIFGTKGKNHEDVEFSYISVMRGRDLRQADTDSRPIEQDAAATDRAFAGYESSSEDSPAAPPHSLSLPRAVLPPLKRQGHVIIDLCTPAGTLERWTVPRSFSKQAYRDARKCAWGDLWALGAKTRVPRNIKVGKTSGAMDVDGVVKGRSGKEKYPPQAGQTSSSLKVPGGLMRGRKVKGIRDKRDKKGEGNGRRKNRVV